MHIRKAELKDAPVCARLVNFAGEGMPLYLWTKMIEADPALGADPWAVGAKRQQAKIKAGEIDVIEVDCTAVAALTGYPIPEKPEPVPANMPAMFAPLQELENLAPATWYINVVAALPDHRGKGLGSRLLALAEGKARALGLSATSLIVADRNIGAYRLYERFGYHETAGRPIVKEDWECESTEWILMVKEIADEE